MRKDYKYFYYTNDRFLGENCRKEFLSSLREVRKGLITRNCYGLVDFAFLTNIARKKTTTARKVVNNKELIFYKGKLYKSLCYVIRLRGVNYIWKKVI